MGTAAETIRIRYNRLPGQAQFDALVGDPKYFYLLLSGGFGSGKTKGLGHGGLKLCAMNPGCYVGAVSPTYRIQQRALLPTLLEILRQNDVPYVTRVSKGEIVLPWSRHPTDGTRSTIIQLCSADRPDSIKGPNWAGALLDEPMLFKQDAFRFIVSRVRDPRAAVRQVLAAGTPEDLLECQWAADHYWDNPGPRTKTVFASTEDAVNAGVVPREFLENLYDTLPEQMQRAYIHGQMVSFKASVVYWSFNVRRDVTSNLLYDPLLPLYFAFDFNVNPLTCTILQPTVLQVPGTDREVQGALAIDELYLRNSNTYKACAELVRRYPPEKHVGGVEIFGDATGRARKTSATMTDYAIIRSELSGYNNLTVLVPKENPKEWERVLSVNNAFEKGRIVVDGDKCPMLVRDLLRTPKAEGQNAIDKKKDKMLTHSSDNLGYFIWRMRTRWGGVVAAASGSTVSRRGTGRGMVERQASPIDVPTLRGTRKWGFGVGVR